MIRTGPLVAGIAWSLIACGGSEGDAAVARGDAADPVESVCRVAGATRALPREVYESSGLARSRRDPTLFWTHNDRGHGPDLFAVREDGHLVGTVRIAGASSIDWEDLEVGACPTGSCLYVGDIGDNDARRDFVTVHRIPEPDPGARTADPGDALHLRYPDGPRDAEALFVLPTGELFLVDKGRREEIALYRSPPTGAPGEVATLERVRGLFPAPGDGDDRVTAATSTPDGRWIGIRTYRMLYIYAADRLVSGGTTEPMTVDLTPLSQPQGEGLAMADDGTVWLSSEADGRPGGPSLDRLDCDLPGATPSPDPDPGPEEGG